MNRNLGKGERGLRVLAAVGLWVCAVIAPLSLSVRVWGFGLSGLYVLGTAFVGTCLGYRVLGWSSCAPRRSDRTQT